MEQCFAGVVTLKERFKSGTNVANNNTNIGMQIQDFSFSPKKYRNQVLCQAGIDYIYTTKYVAFKHGG